jgi:tripartite-type tricarboxylate transporter receptor subunit TctC
VRTLFAISILFTAASALAQGSFPSQPVTIVVPYPPGGTTDIVPRLMQQDLSRRLGVPVVIENRPGAGGGIGTAFAARANPDGYTVVVANNQTMAINPWVYKQLQYDPEKDFTAVMDAGTSPNLLAVHPSVPAKNLSELIALAKAKPGTLTYASSGAGSTSHLCGAMLASLAGIKIEHVPYKGPAPAHQDLNAGRVSMMCDAISNMTKEVESGRLRGIAVADPKRHRALPNVPSAPEAGLPGLEMSFFIGFAVPKATPAAVVERLNRDMVAALRSPEVVKRIEALGITVVGDTPREFAARISAESTKFRKLVQESGASVN